MLKTRNLFTESGFLLHPLWVADLPRYLRGTVPRSRLANVQKHPYTLKNSTIEEARMSKSTWVGVALAVCCLATCIRPVSAQKLEATVLYRQNSDSDYRPLVPGYSDPASPDCAAELGNAECYNPPQAQANSNAVSYTVVGTTLSLLLPDGRVAVVNCLNKYSSRRTSVIRRNCGMPLVEHVEAEFKGTTAKLEWPIGPDGGRIESEKYTVVAVLAKR